MKNNIYYSVLPKGYDLKQMHVIMLASTARTAIRQYEVWNGPNYKLTKKDMKELGLEVRKVNLDAFK